MRESTTDNNADLKRDDEAVYWHARLTSGAMSAEETAMFERWISASEDNRQAYSKLAALLAITDAGAEQLLADAFEDELNEAAFAKQTNHNRYKLIMAIAASFVLVCAAVITVSLSDKLTDPSGQYATNIGERNNIKLADGSLVELNANSTIEVTLNRRERNVNLDSGQAVFVVERDINRPFVVSTEQAKITVTGTIFDVDVFHQESIISVVSGVVEVMPKAGEPVTLLAGDSISVDALGVAADVRRFDPNETLSWRTGVLRFRATPLGDVVGKLNRHFGKQIILEDDADQSLKVTGEFNTTDQDAAVNALMLIFSMEKAETADSILLARKKE